MKYFNSAIYPISLLCFAATSFCQSDIAIRQDVSSHSKYLVGNEETKITKEYVTAVALDGMRRLFESGLEFLTRESGSTIREIERKKEAVECAFKYALITNEEEYWSPHYVSCVGETNQITGSIFRDCANGLICIKAKLDNNDLKFYKKTGYFNNWAGTWYIPGPLMVLYWAMKNIGKAALNLSNAKDAENEFLLDMKAIVDIIEARKAGTGPKSYIDEMNQRFESVQIAIDTHAKSKVGQSQGILNLMNLRLTEEGASKVGQVAFEEVNRAYASKPITNENAKALALFVLSDPVISTLLKKQNGEDLQDSLDEVIEAYDIIAKKYKEQSSSNKQPVRMAEKMKLAAKTLNAYYFNDMHGFSNHTIEADPLKNAFKIGRILNKNAKTDEYDPENRSAARVKEQDDRIDSFKTLNTQQVPMLSDGETHEPLQNSNTKIKEEL